MAGKDLFNKVQCTNCQEEISGVRVQCCDCIDFDICLQCFVSGAEIGPHRNDHAYKFVDHCAVIIGGRYGWTGEEELQLLDAVELYGFGNWELISQYVKTRTPEECKDEYNNRYLNGNIGKVTWGDAEKRRPILQDHVPEDTGPLAPSVIAKLPLLDITPEEALLLGYKPHRDDFEREFDMSAERLVSSIQLDTTQDSKIEVVLKLAMVDMYTRKLRERARRKRLIRDYQLVAKFFANHRKDPNQKPLNREQKDLRDRMKIFTQYMTSGEHERLIASLEREKELRFRLSELLRYRGLGLTTQDEIIHYEQHAAFVKQQNNKTGSSGLPMFSQEEEIKNGKKENAPNLSDEKFTLQVDEESESANFNNCNILINWNCEQMSESFIRAQPMSRFLSQHEIRLCTSINILPIHYIILKTHIIQENMAFPNKYKNIELNENQKPLDAKDVIFQYLKYAGWLS